MSSRNRGLIIAMIVLGGVGIIVTSRSSLYMLMEVFDTFFDVNYMDGIDAIFLVFMCFVAVVQFIVRAVGIVFASVCISTKSKKFILVSSILNMIIFDLFGIICGTIGFIVYANMRKGVANESQSDIVDSEETQDKDIDGGLNIYKDNIYGMKK